MLSNNDSSLARVAGVLVTSTIAPTTRDDLEAAGDLIWDIWYCFKHEISETFKLVRNKVADALHPNDQCKPGE